MAIDLKSLDLGGTAASSTANKSAGKASTAPQTQSAPQQESAGGKSEVSITSTASLLSRVQQALGGEAPFDQKRVDSIRQAIGKGTYTVNPDKIAHGLVQSERVLGKLET